MARFVFLMVLLVCLVCALQAKPAADGDSEELNVKLQNTWDNVKNAVQKEYENIMQNRNVQEFLEGTKSAFEKAGETIRKGAEKVGEQF